LVLMMFALPAVAGEGDVHHEEVHQESAEEPPTPAEPVAADAAPPVPVERAEPPTPPVEEAVHVDPVPQDPVPEEPVPAPTPEPIVEEVVQEVVKEKTVPAPKERTTGSMESKVNCMLDKIKNISQNDAKKIAAAVVGVWGVSAGVGWIAQNANNNNDIKKK